MRASDPSLVRELFLLIPPVKHLSDPIDQFLARKAPTESKLPSCKECRMSVWVKKRLQYQQSAQIETGKVLGKGSSPDDPEWKRHIQDAYAPAAN